MPKPICEMHDDKCANGYKTQDRTYCLNCLHGGDYHAEMQTWLDRLVYWFVLGRTTGCTVGSWCKCKKLLPDDNLKYVEELSKRDE